MKVAYRSDTGVKRAHNEDSVGTALNKGRQLLCMLCDGVGGHKSGEVASRMVINELSTAWHQSETLEEEEIAQWLIFNIQQANKTVNEQSKKYADLDGMATTIVCFVVVNDRLICAHTGDSRLYIKRANILKQITYDHTLVNDLLALGGLSQEEAENHPMTHVITRAIGHKATIDVDITRVGLKDKDIVMLCSDGLTDMLSNQEMVDVFKTWQTLQNYTNQLITLANKAGGKDNVTVLLAQYEEKGGA